MTGGAGSAARRYTLDATDLADLQRAAQTPGVLLGGPLKGYEPAKAASDKVWQEIGERMGFRWATVKPVEGTTDTITAVPS